MLCHMCFDCSSKAGKIYKMCVKMIHNEILESEVETSRINVSHCILPYCFMVSFLVWRNFKVGF